MKYIAIIAVSVLLSVCISHKVTCSYIDRSTEIQRGNFELIKGCANNQEKIVEYLAGKAVKGEGNAMAFENAMFYIEGVGEVSAKEWAEHTNEFLEGEIK